MAVNYNLESDLSIDEFIDLLERSTLSDRRPVQDIERINKMLQNADIIITARENGKLIGVSRAISDFSFCTYLSDLAVDVSFQNKGIGKRLIYETKIKGGEGKLILLSAPQAVRYYPKIGMQHFDQCYIIDHQNQIL
jgi:predicted N-acetyltransferase YhbS